MSLQVLLPFVGCIYCLCFGNKQLAFNIITKEFTEAKTKVRKTKGNNSRRDKSLFTYDFYFCTRRFLLQ